MSKDLHKYPFDENTKIKLSLFREYLNLWLFVFLAKKDIIWNNINIFDFFAGPGKDCEEYYGTPLIIINELYKKKKFINDNNVNINIFLNEYDKSKYDQLNKTVKEYTKDKSFKIYLDNLNFEEAFLKYDRMLMNRSAANLLFLDQSGIKHITKEIFLKIISLKTTDFILFISSSTISRFYEDENIKKYLDTSKINLKSGYYNIHRSVVNYYRSIIPNNLKYYVVPFSIKKGSNIYGLIFGTHHLNGVYKFLLICWNKDPQRGEANFDIDKEKINPEEPSFFPDFNRPKKLLVYEKELKQKILNKELITDKDVVIYSLINGFLPKHAKKIVSKMKKDKKINLSGGNFSEKTITNSYIGKHIDIINV